MSQAQPESPTQRSLAQRLGWFVLLWCGGVGTVLTTSLLLRWWLHS